MTDSEKQISRPAAPASDAVDPASQSLANALQVSFKMLAGLMVVMAALYVFTGFTTVADKQKGIVKIFGRITGTAGPGPVLNWPFPIGDVDKVSISLQTVEINDFWMHETPEDMKEEQLDKRKAAAKGLRPGWDGALLTGDRNLLHVKLNCNYQIRNPVAYRAGVDDLKVTVHDIVCRSAIIAAARRTADGIRRTEKTAFMEDVAKLSQEQINVLLGSNPADPDVIVSQVNISRESWPIRSLTAFAEAQQATNNAAKNIQNAYATAENVLRKAAGPNYAVLVGAPYHPDASDNALRVTKLAESQDYDLIDQYEELIAAEKPQQAHEVLARINQQLSLMTGSVSDVLGKASAQKTEQIKRIASRYEKYQKLLEIYLASPEFTLKSLWAKEYDEILNSPVAEKFYITTGDGKTVLKLGRDPKTVTAIKNAELEDKNKNKNKK